MGLRSFLLCISPLQLTTSPKSTGIDNDDAENQIVVENDARDVQIHCLINTDGLPLSDLGLYLCPTMAQCRNDRDSYIISRIESRSVYNYYPKQYKLSLNGTLTVTKMSSKHDGMVVWCIGKVRHHGVRENTTVIQIARERPTIRIKSPQLFSVVKGMTLHLDCEANGFPTPQVIWFRTRDRKVLLNRTNDEATSLVRRNVTKDDEGGYNCTATNLLGSDRYEVQVNVIGSPKLILVSPQDIYVYVRMDLYLEAQVEGYPYPWVSLSHDQHVLQNRSNFTSSNILLKVNSNITKANGGLYIICAGNPYRNHCLIMRVHVQGMTRLYTNRFCVIQITKEVESVRPPTNGQLTCF
ncbi:Inactive tyrosine-protein kinase 7 [Stylophora pistillata]|uniref:Inactive tyrosine-protein kinase 7 n=1 Tax=Stylophora pistillata TaxID=50429 RepID=A0A2B4SKM1_STYPI|nr:Inactive tyrosine-protein kinase 7 [Stylophora pistillata]